MPLAPDALYEDIESSGHESRESLPSDISPWHEPIDTSDPGLLSSLQGRPLVLGLGFGARGGRTCETELIDATTEHVAGTPMSHAGYELATNLKAPLLNALKPASSMHPARRALQGLLKISAQPGQVLESWVELRRSSRVMAHYREDNDRLQTAYHEIPAWFSGRLSRETREAQQRFWREQGTAGVKWLIRRLRSETDAETATDVANLLADLGAESVEPVVGELEQAPPAEAAAALLKSLGWTRPPVPSGDLGNRVQRIVERYLLEDDPIIRESAAAAARFLEPEVAEGLLRRALEAERDPGVRETLEQELVGGT